MGVYGYERLTGDFLTKKTLLTCALKINQNRELDLEEIKRAQHILCVLKHTVQRRNVEPPINISIAERKYLCPLSGKFMSNPVRITMTTPVDRETIEKWLDDGHQTCYQSKILTDLFQFEEDETLGNKTIPNWLKGRLNAAVNRLHSTSMEDMKGAAHEIRQLTKYSVDCRTFLGESDDGIDTLFRTLTLLDLDPRIREDLIGIVYNLSLDDDYKELFSTMATFPTLIGRCLIHGNSEARKLAAKTISLIVAKDTKLEKFATTIRGLVRLLKGDGAISCQDVAATTLFDLCLKSDRNKELAIYEGVVDAIMERLWYKDTNSVSKLLALFVVLSKSPLIIDELKSLKLAERLFHFLESKWTTEVDKEHCVILLHLMCEYSDGHRKMIKKLEKTSRAIARVMATGTPSAQEGGLDILKLIKTHTNGTPKALVKKNGTPKETLDNGSSEALIKTNGTPKETLANGSLEALIKTNGTPKETFDNGSLEALIKTNGTPKKTFDNGSLEALIKTNGTPKETLANGSVEALIKTNGTPKETLTNETPEALIKTNGTPKETLANGIPKALIKTNGTPKETVANRTPKAIIKKNRTPKWTLDNGIPKAQEGKLDNFNFIKTLDKDNNLIKT